MHSGAEIAPPLPDSAHRNAPPRAVRRKREQGLEAPVARKCAQQALRRALVEAKCGAVADVAGEPALHGAESRRAGEHDADPPHP